MVHHDGAIVDGLVHRRASRKPQGHTRWHSMWHRADEDLLDGHGWGPVDDLRQTSKHADKEGWRKLLNQPEGA